MHVLIRPIKVYFTSVFHFQSNKQEEFRVEFICVSRKEVEVGIFVIKTGKYCNNLAA